jgi:hypothetical protein
MYPPTVSLALHSFLIRTMSARKQCRYPTGQCPRGDGCMFSHAQGRRAGTQLSLPLPLAGPPSTSITSQKKDRPLCKYFATGSCIYGDSCRQTHDASENMKSPVVWRVQVRRGISIQSRRRNCAIFAAACRLTTCGKIL